MDIYLIRHFAPSVAPGVCYGQTEVGLAPGWEASFAELLVKLPSSFDRVYSSPWPRCRRLAQRLSSQVIEDSRWQELHFGEWEGLPWAVIDQNALNVWMKDFVNVACPGGESYQELALRVVSAWDELLAQNLATVAIITHAGPIRAILSAVLELPLEHSFRLAISYGKVSLVRAENQPPVIQFINK